MQYSIVQYNKVKKDSDCARIDAEFFKKEYLSIDALLRKKPYKDLKDFGVTIHHPNEIKREYVETGGVLFLRAQNVRPLEIDLDSNRVYISEEDAKMLGKNHITNKDVLITRTGANFGQCAIYLEKENVIASSHTFIVKTSRLNPFFLTVFLNTTYGRKLIDKGMYGATQPEIAPFYLYRIPAPLLKDYFYVTIEKAYRKSFDFITQAKALYSQAEQILLSELGLLDWKPKQQLSFIKKFSDTKTAERIDAEYFQPMYDEIISKFQKNSKCDVLENITNLIGHPSNPPYASEESKNKTFIITQKHLGNYSPTNNFWEDEEALYTTDEFIKDNKQYVLQANDIILYSVGAYIGKANIYNSDIQATIGSFLTLIRPDQEKINPYYLLVFLNSELGKQLTRRCSRGMAQQYIYPFDIRKFIISLIHKSKQTEIEKKMIAALDAKKHSKHLLDIAKRSVEMAIEKDEKQAQNWINSELKKFNITLK